MGAATGTSDGSTGGDAPSAGITRILVGGATGVREDTTILLFSFINSSHLYDRSYAVGSKYGPKTVNNGKIVGWLSAISTVSAVV